MSEDIPQYNPFDANLIARFNHTTWYPTTVAKANADYNAQVAADRQIAVEKLAKFGIDEVPEDIEKALARLAQTRARMFYANVRAREIAPPITVTGPSGWAKRARPEKARAMEQKAFEQFEYAKKKMLLIVNRYDPEAPISSDDPQAIEKLQFRIDRAEKNQERMKFANKIVDSKKLSLEEKVKQLTEHKFKAVTLLTPDFCGRLGFPSYLLTNNLANIKRMKERVKQLEAAKLDVEKEWKDEEKDIRVVDSPTENRLMIFFPGKPEKEVIEQLKSYGFRWSPTSGAWQRYRSYQANAAAKIITGIDTLS